MLTLENITKSYYIADEQIKVLDHLSITFPARGLIGIKGESGCGKSTLLNIISSLEKMDEGKILYKNQEIDNQYLKKEITFISQNLDLISSLKVKDNITIANKIANISYSSLKLKKIIKSLELDKVLSLYPYQLSGGQKRRVSIARGILKDASILLADEPTGSLHFEQAKEVMELLKQQSYNRLVIIVSHDDELLEEYCDDILVLKNGKLKGCIREKDEIEREEREEKKYSLLFYVISQMKSQKYMLLLLVIFQIIIITSLTLLITSMNGLEYAINSYYQSRTDKNIMTIEKLDGNIFDVLPDIDDAIVSYDYILSYGELSEDVNMTFLPNDLSHIKLKEGKLPTKNNQVIISESLNKKIHSSLIYTYYDQNIQLEVVGIIEENLFKDKSVYFPLSFQNNIPDFINKQILVIESQKCKELYQELSDDYIVYSDVIEGEESYTTLLNLGMMICLIFFCVSFVCSFFLFYIVYSTIGIKRKSDSAILIMMGLSHRFLFLLFILEALCIGISMSVIGVICSYIVYYYMNEVIVLKEYVSFSLRLKAYFLTSYDLYFLLILIYSLLSVICAFIPAKRIVNADLVSMLREE